MLERKFFRRWWVGACVWHKNSLTLAMLFLLCGKCVANPMSITLKDAFRSAFEKTETVPIGKSRVDQSDARIDQAKSRFLPVLSFGANYQQQDTGGVSLLGGGGQSYTRFTLSQSVFEGGRDLATLDTNKSDKEAQKHTLSFASYTLFTNVANSFYAVLSDKTDIENVNKTIALTLDRVRVLKYQEKIGRSRKVEVLAAQAQIAVLEAQRVTVEGQLSVDWDQFILITGLSKDVELVKTYEVATAPKSLETYLARIEQRPDIMAMKAQKAMAESNIRVMRAGHLPSVQLLGNYYVTRDGAQKGNHWDAGATLTLPLFAGGLVRAQMAESYAKVAETDYLLLQMRRQAEISIRTAYNNFISGLHQVETLQKALTVTEQNYQEQEKNYRFSQVTNLDVIQALNLFQDTKRTLDRTRYLTLSSLAALKAASVDVSLDL